MPELDPVAVTVGIPAYNSQRTIDETLWSVRNQTYPNFQVVVVDDGSTDGTAAIVQKHIDADDRITLLRKANGGVASARNMALAHARAPLFANLDADDLWHPTMLERQVDAFKAGGERIVLCYTWFSYIDAQSRVVSVARPSDEGNVIARMCRGNVIGNGSSAVMRTAVLRDAGGWDPTLAGRNDDYDLFFAVAERGEFAVIREPLLGYRQTRDNTTSHSARMMATYDVVASKYRARHATYADQFAAGRKDLIAYLFDKAVLNRRWQAVLSLLRQAWSSDPQFAISLVGTLPPIVLRIVLPLGLRAMLRPLPTDNLRKGSPYLPV